jgi:hypothetical protein
VPPYDPNNSDTVNPARYFVSELTSAVGDGKVILSRTGLGASLGNGVII